MFEREHRTLAFVPRWAIIRVNRQQNVAEHSFFVTMYADRIAAFIGWRGPRDVLMRYAMFHDMDEILTGDVSAPSKKVMQNAAQSGWGLVEKWLNQLMKVRIRAYDYYVSLPKEWEEEIKAIVLVADLLEAVMFLADEEMSGNGNVRAVRLHCEEKLWKAIDKLPAMQHTLAAYVSGCIGEALGRCDVVVTGKEEIR